MENGSDDASASVLFGLPGFVVRAQTMRGDEWWLAIETMRSRSACPTCGVFGVGNGRRQVVVRDLPIGGVPVIVVWAKRTFRCREALCAQGSWSETSPQIARRAVLTERARKHIYRRVGRDLDTVAELAREFGVGWATAHQCVIDYGDTAIAADDRLEAVTDLGVDEHTFAHGASDGGTKMATTFVDLKRGRLLDVTRGRSGEVVRDWVRSQPIWWADQIEVAAIDAFRGYANAIDDVLDATLVIDHFHAIRLANQAITHVRQRVQNETLGHRGRKDDPLYRIRRLALARRLTERGWQRLLDGLNAGDPNGEVAAAIVARELLADVYAADGHEHAQRRLNVFLQYCADSDIAELFRLARTVDTWRDEIIAYHLTGGASNGPTEAVNLVIEKIRRIGHGYRNFTNYRRRLLLGCGITWTTVPVCRIRGRHTASVA
jgi:transposase